MRKDKMKDKDINMDENIENEEVSSENGKETGVEENAQETENISDESEDIDPIDKLQDELSEAKDKYLRLYSEYENFRRRTAREKLDMMQTATENLMVALLPIIDDMDRAQDSFKSQKDVKAAKEGLKLITGKFDKTLGQKGLKEMDTKAGTDFDTELHEAITQIPAPKPKLKGKIVDTIEKGYFLGEKVIRHAKVVIGN